MSTHHLYIPTWGRMLNEEPEPQAEMEFRCCICQEPVYFGETTEHGLKIEVCRNSVCVDKRLQQLLDAEKRVAAIERQMRIVLTEVALKCEFEANNLGPS